VKALILAILLAITSLGERPQTDFEFVCEQLENIYGDTCEGIDPPIVVVSEIVHYVSTSLNGLVLPGEPYIFVAPDGSNPAKTTVHETVHYVMVQQNNPDMKDVCRAEEVARFIAGQPWGEGEKYFYRGCSDAA
jgi:hypothetical protein